MVTCKLMGGMGNQMFQIATTIALALRNESKYGIPQTFSDSKRKIAFTHFPLATDGDIVSVYNESAFTHSEIPYQEGVCLNGYFQSEKYFLDYKEEVIDAFGLKCKETPGVVSLHIRRGDYINLENFHPFVGMEYIKESIERFLLCGHRNFMVFSDDIPWCKNHITQTQFPLCRFLYSEGKTEIEDMKLMSSCEHNIIANSSFSWWGAWLNPNPDKMVIAPKRWFGESLNHNTKDLIPEGWIVL